MALFSLCVFLIHTYFSCQACSLATVISAVITVRFVCGWKVRLTLLVAESWHVCLVGSS